MVVFVGGAVLVGLWLLRRRAAAVAGAGPMAEQRTAYPADRHRQG